MENTGPFTALMELCRSLVSGDSLSAEERLEERRRRKTPQFSLLGRLSAGKSTPYSINGVDFEIDSNTSIFGELRFGAQAKVVGYYRRHTMRCAQKVFVEAPRHTERSSELNPPGRVTAP